MFRSPRTRRLLRALAPPALLAGLVLLALVPAAAAQDVLVARWVDPEGGELARRTLGLDALEALDPAAIETATPWSEGVARYTGPRLAALASLEQGPVVEARLIALDGYRVAVPSRDWRSHDLVLATRADGERMRVRDNGPLWLIYPLDSDPALQTRRHHARMIWQVREIVFVTGAP